MLPYPESIDLPFRGKTLRTRLTHKAVMKAENDLGLNILYFQEPMLLRKPVAFQLAAWLYVLTAHKLAGVTLDECIDASMGDDREAYMGMFAKFIEQLQPVLMDLNGHQEATEKQAPLAEFSGGESDGPPLESTSA